MRQTLRVFGLALLLGLAAAAQAQEPAAPVMGESLSAARIGVAAAVRGQVHLSRGAIVGKDLSSGAPVYLGDAITTGDAASLQILLLDETAFTIGPNSSLVVDTFVYDPSTSTGKVVATVTKGVFRFISGKIAKLDPDAMKVHVPNGSVGVRGTIVMGKVDDQQSQVVLLGPGPQNPAGEPPGLITVGNDKGSVSINRPGFGSRIAGDGQPPSPPALVPPAELAAMAGALETPPASESDQDQGGGEQAGGDADGGAESADMGEAPGSEATDLDSLDSIADLGEIMGEAAEVSADASQDSIDDANSTAAIHDGIAQLELRTIETGTFSYLGSGPFTQTIPTVWVGTVDWDIDIDFGSRTIGGSGSLVQVTNIAFGGTIVSNDVLEAQSFASGSGDATFNWVSTDTHHTSTVTLKNESGVAGAKAEVSTAYDNGPDVGASTTLTLSR